MNATLTPPRLRSNYVHPNGSTMRFTGNTQGGFYEFVQTDPRLPAPDWLRWHYFSVDGFKTEGKSVSASNTYQHVSQIPESVMAAMLNELIRKKMKKIFRGKI